MAWTKEQLEVLEQLEVEKEKEELSKKLVREYNLMKERYGD